ncbi:MAG: single-stranded-DNA-specific exonuclease RecJ [Planctomycetota bacterium]
MDATMTARTQSDAPTLPRKRWEVRAWPDNCADLARDTDVSELVAGLLKQRGIHDAEAARKFLKPTLADLLDPSDLPGCDDAAHRLAKALRQNEKIVIYGDYDVDGITASAILYHTLTLLGGEVATYVPHRIEEGYGLNGDAVRALADAGVDVIVTVDCGITATEQATIAANRGIDLIITDHHTPTQKGDSPLFPECCAIVHPQAGEGYANHDLCGAGVAFKLAWAVGRCVAGGSRVHPKLRDFLVDAVGLAALGTVADVVPLTGENRVLARHGLAGLKHSNLDGVKALIKVAGLDGQDVDAFDVGFKVGPRLNAAGRMGHARQAVDLLTTAPLHEAVDIAEFLAKQNTTRQATEREIVAAAIEQIESAGFATDDRRAIVVAGDDWHQGVVGIVASRLVERYCRPTVVLAGCEDGSLTGSARSIPGFDLAAALAHCTDHLQRHGGHAMAAGLTLDAANLDAFRDALTAHANDLLEPTDLVPRLRIDAEATLDQLTPALVKQLALLGPFGAGNSRPVFVFRNVLLAADPRPVGRNGDHLQLRVRSGQTPMKCIAFKMGPHATELRQGQRLDIAGVPSLNHWNGMTSVELEVRDITVR